MDRRFLVILVTLIMLLPLAFFGCKGKVEKAEEDISLEMTEALMQDQIQGGVVTEPAETVATETIPATAAPEIAPKVTMPQERDIRNRQIQRALKNAGFYTGAVDGKIGPKTKRAIEEFQRAKGLKVDGKVGPKTWAELEKYLTQ